MKILGIDYGARRIGIALSDAGGSFGFPHSTIWNDEKALTTIRELCIREEVKEIVMGDTRAGNENSNEITAEAEQFARDLERIAERPVRLVREAWSSQEAARFSPDGTHDDAAAAAIILQRYLDTRR